MRLLKIKFYFVLRIYIINLHIIIILEKSKTRSNPKKSIENRIFYMSNILRIFHKSNLVISLAFNIDLNLLTNSKILDTFVY